LQLPDDAVINIPADDKNAMVKVVNNNGSWKRQDNGEDVSNIPFSGVFSIYYESSKTPSYITVSSKHQSAKQYHPAFDPGTRDSHHELAGFDGPDGTP